MNQGGSFNCTAAILIFNNFAHVKICFSHVLIILHTLRKIIAFELVHGFFTEMKDAA